MRTKSLYKPILLLLIGCFWISYGQAQTILLGDTPCSAPTVSITNSFCNTLGFDNN